MDSDQSQVKNSFQDLIKSPSEVGAESQNESYKKRLTPIINTKFVAKDKVEDVKVKNLKS